MNVTIIKSKITESAKENVILFLFIIPLATAFFLLINVYLLSIGFYDDINTVFDFDQAWFIETLGYSSYDWKIKTAHESPPLLIKHPFLYLYRLPCEIFQFFGISPEISVIFVCVIFHVGLIIVAYFIFFEILQCAFKASLMTLFMLCSSTFLVNGIVLDSYVLAGFWISCCYYLYIKSYNKPGLEVTWLKIFVYAMAIGTTTYLLLLILLLEVSLLTTKKNSLNNKDIYKYLISGIVRFLLIFGTLFFICYYQSIYELLSNPVEVIKRTLWSVVRPGEKQGLLSIMTTFLAHTFIAPFHHVVEIGPDNLMADFRSGRFSFIGYIGLGALLFLYIRAFIHRDSLLFIAAVWLVITMLFHVEYQDRGSLFLYTGHTMLASSIIIAFGFKGLPLKKAGLLAGLLIISIAYNNLNAIFYAIQSVYLV
ncbi:hypothetical protein [Vibrio alfacsensis]|uniref:hypothetical protein n=1 Tax=Vibrio alfacsensis TaxID=1074311 RepID=UPI0040678E4B